MAEKEMQDCAVCRGGACSGGAGKRSVTQCKGMNECLLVM